MICKKPTLGMASKAKLKASKAMTSLLLFASSDRKGVIPAT